jgi:hypothetical protein
MIKKTKIIDKSNKKIDNNQLQKKIINIIEIYNLDIFKEIL